MRDRLGLFSREQCVELALTLAIAITVVAISQCDWYASGRWRFELAMILVLCEVPFAFTKVRHVSRQFAPRQQTEWFVTAGTIDRAELSRAYVIALVWRAVYHTAVIGGAAVIAKLIPDNLSRLHFFVTLMAWQWFVRIIVAMYRHIAGSRIVPGFVRATLEPAALTWWRFPAQIVLMVLVAFVAAMVFIATAAMPELLGAVASIGTVVVYGLARTSESIEPDTEIALRLPALGRGSGSIAKSRPSELLGLVWFGTKYWWRWMYLPLLVVVLVLLTSAPRDRSDGALAVALGVTLSVTASLWLISVLATTYRVLWPRVFLFIAVLVLTYFMFGFGVLTLALLSSSARDSMRLLALAPRVEAFVLASTSICAAAVSPYGWDSCGNSARHLHSLGVEVSTLRRIELLTGLLLGALAWSALALEFGPLNGSAVGAPAAAACLLLQDRSPHELGGRRFTLRDVTHKWLVLFALAGLVLAAVVSAADSERAAAASGLMIFAAVFCLWLNAWRPSAARAIA